MGILEHNLPVGNAPYQVKTPLAPPPHRMAGPSRPDCDNGLSSVRPEKMDGGQDAVAARLKPKARRRRVKSCNRVRMPSRAAKCRKWLDTGEPFFVHVPPVPAACDYVPTASIPNLKAVRFDAVLPFLLFRSIASSTALDGTGRQPLCCSAPKRTMFMDKGCPALTAKA